MNEFEFIASIRAKYGIDKIGDDCAVLPKDTDIDMLLTTDMLVEDIDFRLNWTTPEYIGHKALAVSLSDIAAMGGVPKWAMLSLGIPKHLWHGDFLDTFYAGWVALARKFKVELVGGDISRSPDKFFVDSIVGGEVAKGKAVLRSGAKPGDAIYVTGSLGGAAGGLKLLEQGSRITSDTADSTATVIKKQIAPAPQLDIGKQLQHLGIITSMIDLSDGLSSDLEHICRASGVGAKVYAERVPMDQDLVQFFPPEVCLEMTLNGGDDFELLFTVSSQTVKEIPGTCIGKITPDTGKLWLVQGDKLEHLSPKGYKHF